MLLSDHIRREHILTGFTAPDKTGALAELCRFAAEASGLPAPAFLEAVTEREMMGSTGLGGGVALPHARSPLLEKPLLIMAISEKGVDFDSLDGRPVRLFVLLLTPAAGGGHEHLQLLARLGALFKSSEAAAEFLAAKTPDEVFGLILKRQ